MIEAADLRLGLLALDAREPLEVEPVQQRLVDAALQLLVLRCRVSTCAAA